MYVYNMFSRFYTCKFFLLETCKIKPVCLSHIALGLYDTDAE